MKKKINIALICAVLGLWGTVIYRSISNYLVKDAELLTGERLSVANFKIVSKDTFELKRLNYDPFLQKHSIPQHTNNASANILKPTSWSKPKVRTESAKAKSILGFPSIGYYGFIKSVDKKEELVILKINGRLRKVRANENFDGLKIKYICKDSLVITNSQESKTFLRN